MIDRLDWDRLKGFLRDDLHVSRVEDVREIWIRPNHIEVEMLLRNRDGLIYAAGDDPASVTYRIPVHYGD